VTFKAGIAVALTGFFFLAASPALAQAPGGSGPGGSGPGGTSGGGTGSPGGGAPTPGAPTSLSTPGASTPGSPSMTNPGKDPNNSCPAGQSRPKTNQPCQPTMNPAPKSK
jgi:hypothetical protein